MDAERIRPFYCGSQAADWFASNCGRCAKSLYDASSIPLCDIERALQVAEDGDGIVSIDIAVRMGVAIDRLVWRCGEWEASEEWKVEFLRRKATKEGSDGR